MPNDIHGNTENYSYTKVKGNVQEGGPGVMSDSMAVFLVF